MLVQFQNCSFFDNYRSTLIAENIRCKMGQNLKLLRIIKKWAILLHIHMIFFSTYEPSQQNIPNHSCFQHRNFYYSYLLFNLSCWGYCDSVILWYYFF